MVWAHARVAPPPRGRAARAPVHDTYTHKPHSASAPRDRNYNNSYSRGAKSSYSCIAEASHAQGPTP
eukprot:5761508-Prymnesium_polylepis.2